MAKPTTRTTTREHIAHYVVYDRRSGEILAVHHLVALPGVRMPSDALVERKVVACAAEALKRRPADLRVLSTPDAQTVIPGMRVDITEGILRSASSQEGQRQGGDSVEHRLATEVDAEFRSP